MQVMTLTPTVTDKQEIAKYFYDNQLKRCTPLIYKKQISFAGNLLEAGFTKEEIISVIDYLIKCPPRGGFFSLAYLPYVMQEILVKLQVRAIQNHTEDVVDMEPEETDEDNRKKYLEGTKAKLKNMFNI